MKRIQYILAGLSMVLLMGCAVEENNIETPERHVKQEKDVEPGWDFELEDQTVTKEWLMKEYKLSESDFAGIDVEKTAWYLWLTKESVIKQYGDDYNKLLFSLHHMQQSLNACEPDDKGIVRSNILWYRGMEGELPDFKDLEVIEISNVVSEDECHAEISAYIDVKNKTIAFGNNCDVYLSIVNNRDDCEKYDLSDDELQKILDSLDKDYFDPSVKSNDWRMAFKYTDGSIYNYELKDVNRDTDKYNMLMLIFDKMQERVRGINFFSFYEE